MLRSGVLLGFVAALLLGMALLFQAGRRLGARYRVRSAGSPTPAFAALAGATFALMGLLLAFAFSGATARLDARRQLAVTEANAIGTAYLRIDVLPAARQPRLRQEFRDYLDSRIATYRLFPDEAAVRAELARSATLQRAIWQDGLSAAREAEGTSAMFLMVPALNQMIDITTTRTSALFVHPPLMVFGTLALVLLACALLAGFEVGDSRSSPAHVVSFIGLLALTVFVTINLEYPRIGLLPIDMLDQVLVDLRQGMG